MTLTDIRVIPRRVFRGSAIPSAMLLILRLFACADVLSAGAHNVSELSVTVVFPSIEDLRNFFSLATKANARAKSDVQRKLTAKLCLIHPEHPDSNKAKRCAELEITNNAASFIYPNVEPVRYGVNLSGDFITEQPAINVPNSSQRIVRKFVMVPKGRPKAAERSDGARRNEWFVLASWPPQLSSAPDENQSATPQYASAGTVAADSEQDFLARLGAEIVLADATRRLIVTEFQMTALPVPGVRALDTLALLGSGVLPAPATNNPPGPGLSASLGSAGQFTVNGLRSRDNNFSIDGSDNNEEDVGVRRQGFVALTPQSMESVAELQVVTAMGDARFGRNIGGVNNVLSRLGGERVHGAVYSYFTDRRMNARNFFDSSGKGSGSTRLPILGNGQAAQLDGRAMTQADPNVETAPYTRTQTGFVLSGPISKKPLLPDGERTYFYGAFEKQQVRARQMSHFAVPATAERGLFNTGGAGFSRLGSQRIAMTPASVPGNAIFSLYPFPNNSAGPYGETTYSRALGSDAEAIVASLKMDRRFGRHHVTGRYNFTGENSEMPVTGDAIDSSLGPRMRTQNLAFFLNTDFGAHTAQTVRFSYGRTSSHFERAQNGGNLGSQDLPGTSFLLNKPLLLDVTRPGLAPNYVSNKSPAFQTILAGLGYANAAKATTETITGPLGAVRLAGFSPLGVDVFNFPQTRANNTFQVADSVTHFHGDHLIMAGFDIRRIQINSVLDRNARPMAVFGGLWNGNARLPLVQDGSCNAANCLLDQRILSGTTLAAAGVPTAMYQTLTRTGDASLGVRFNEMGFFLQDSWRVSRHLMLIYGVRYERNTVPKTIRGKLESAFDPAGLAAEAKAVQAQCLGRCDGLTAGLSDISGYALTFRSDRLGFNPRLGFAWNPGGHKLVIRGGAGLYSSPAPGVVISQSRSAFPNSIPLNLVNFPQLSNSGTYLFNLAGSEIRNLNSNLNVIQPGSLNVLDSTSGPLQLMALNLYSLRGALSPTFPALDLVLPARDLRNPRALQFGLTVERELRPGLVASAAYVGTAGFHLFRVSTPRGGLQRGAVQFGNDVTADVSRGTTAGDVVFPYLTGIMRPPPMQTSVSNSFTVAPTVFESLSSSRYHSLQLDLRGTIGKYLQIGSAFTYSHAIDDASDFFDLAGSFALPQNSFQRSERGSSAFDMRMRSVTHFIANLRPVAPPRDWLGRWQAAGIVTMQTGQPYTVNSALDVNQDGNSTDRIQNSSLLVAGTTADRRVRLRMTQGAETTDLLAAAGQDGAVGRNSFRAAGMASVDLSLTKLVPVTERVGLQIRMEGFNVLNRANFAIPVRILESPGFGSSARTQTPARVLQLALKLTF